MENLPAFYRGKGFWLPDTPTSRERGSAASFWIGAQRYTAMGWSPQVALGQPVLRVEL